jgi:hypothetical protein
MDLFKVLVELRQELEYLDIAILSLERFQKKGRQRGASPGPQVAEQGPGGTVPGSGGAPRFTSGRPQRKRLT